MGDKRCKVVAVAAEIQNSVVAGFLPSYFSN